VNFSLHSEIREGEEKTFSKTKICSAQKLHVHFVHCTYIVPTEGGEGYMKRGSNV
jgi:hypothetical protein